MKIAIILNANAGPARRRLPVDDVMVWARTRCARHHAEPVMLLTSGPGHATELARQAVGDGVDVVCAWGGDGTVNEVAAGVSAVGGVLGIVPAGSGNGFARDLGIPLNRDEALDVALAGAVRRVDVGTADGRPFVATAGVGLDAHVAHLFARTSGETRGLGAYVQAAARGLFRFPARRCRVTADGVVVFDERAKLVAVANARQWGNNARIAPAAAPDDGLLDLVTIGDLPSVVLAAQAWRLWTGSIGEVRGVSMHTCREVVIEADEPVPMHIDGEPAGSITRVALSLSPLALSVKVPHGVASRGRD